MDENIDNQDVVEKTSVELDVEEIPETDIVFECPNCGKSLSIDPRGAGLIIECPQCHQKVTVPVPEGMNVEDFDATPEELSFRLSTANKRISNLEKLVADQERELEVLRTFKEATLKRHDTIKDIKQGVISKLTIVEKAEKDLRETLISLLEKLPSHDVG